MKRFLTISAILFVLAALVGCTQYDAAANVPDVADPVEESHSPYDQEDAPHEYDICGSWVVDELTFSSVVDLLNAYLIASEGGNIDHLASEWQTRFGRSQSKTFTEIAANLNFTSLEMLYVPVNIPDELELFTISAGEGSAVFTFIRPEDMVSEDAVRDAFTSSRLFEFSGIYLDMDDSLLFDSMMNQSLEGDILIDGKYLLREHWRGAHSIDWVSDRARFIMRLPAQIKLDGMSPDDPHTMLRFTKMVALDLRDTRAVEAMIAEFAAQ